MFCDNCGNELDNDSSFCGNCGKQITDPLKESAEQTPQTHEVAVQVQEEVTPAPASFGYQAPEPPQKRPVSKGLIIALSILVVLILTGGIVGVLFATGVLGGDTQNGNIDTPMPSTNEQTPPETDSRNSSEESKQEEKANTDPVGYWLNSEVKEDHEIFRFWIILEDGTASGEIITTLPNSGGIAYYNWERTSDQTPNEQPIYGFNVQDEYSMAGAGFHENSGNFFVDKSGNLNDGTFTYERITESKASELHEYALEQKMGGSATKAQYIFPDSSTRLLSASELTGMSSDDLAIAQNEIWARHGRLFKNNWLQAHFNKQSWYTGTISPEDFLSVYTPNDIENKNASLISDTLDSRGYNLNEVHPN